MSLLLEIFAVVLGLCRAGAPDAGRWAAKEEVASC
jgi:hypothetical protein